MKEPKFKLNIQNLKTRNLSNITLNDNNYNVLVTQNSRSSFSLKDSINVIKNKRKIDLKNFHTNSLRESLTYNSIANKGTIYTSDFSNMIMESARSNKSNKQINSYNYTNTKLRNNANFYYDMVSGSLSRETISQFTTKTLKSAKMKFIKEIQKEAITRNKEEEKNKIEEYTDQIENFKINRKLLEKEFMPCLDKHIRYLRKQVEIEKIEYYKLKNEYEKQKNKISEMQMNIDAIKKKIELGQEYVIFLSCLNSQTSMTTPLVNNFNINSKSFFKRNSVNQKKYYSYILEDLDKEGLVEGFSRLENEVFDLIEILDKKKDFIERHSKRTVEEETGEQPDERIIEAENKLKRQKLYYEELSLEKKLQDDIIQLENGFQAEINKIYESVASLDINKKEEIDILLQENRRSLKQLNIIEKSLVFLKIKKKTYMDNPHLSEKAIDILEGLEKQRRMRILAKNQDDLKRAKEIRIEKDRKRREYLEAFSNKNKRVIPYKRPKTESSLGNICNYKNEKEEFYELIEY